MKRPGPFSRKGLEQPRSTLPFERRPKRAKGGWTDAQLETLPYFKEEVQAQESEFNLLTPIEWLFDALSRGQYMTANLAEDISRASRGEDANIVQGLLDGLSGKRKGDWKTTLFGGKDEGEEIDFTGLWEAPPEWMDAALETPLGDISTKDVAGFIANVLLDPLTYVSFGATKAGKKAAKNFSEVALEGAKKATHNIDNIAKFAKKSFKPEKFQELLEKGGKKGAKLADEYLAKHASKADISRFYSKIMRDAERQAMRMTATEAQEKLIKNVVENKDKFVEQASKRYSTTKHKKAIQFLEENLGSAEKAGGLKGLVDYEDALKILKDPATTTDQAQAVYKKLLGIVGDEALSLSPAKGKLGRSMQTVQDYAKEIEHMYSDEFLQQFKGMGERSMLKILGFEPGKYQATTAGPWGSFAKFREYLRTTKPGDLFERAVYSVTEGNPASAWVRNAFGIRNPYQKYLRTKELNLEHLYKHYANQEIDQIESIFKDVDEKEMNVVRDIMMEYEGSDMGAMTPEMLQKFGADPENAEKINKLFANVREYTGRLKEKEMELAAEGFLPEYESIENYLPTVMRKRLKGGKKLPGRQQTKWFTKDKTFTLKQRADMEAAKIKAMTGLDDATVQKIVREKNWSPLNMDLREMLAHRGLAHAQAKKQADFIKQFRELGVNFKKNPVQQSTAFQKFKGGDGRYSKDLITALRADPGVLDRIGMSTVKSPGFKGYYFDKDVSQIIDRTMSAIGSDDAINKFDQFFTKASSLWRAYATLSPGFHLRNLKSNIWINYIKDGYKSFTPKRDAEQVLGTFYALVPEFRAKHLNDIPKSKINKILNRQIGGKTVKEWADFATKRGIISKTSKGFDASAIEKIFKKSDLLKETLNPSSLDNFLLSRSKDIGGFVESTPKFGSFLTDIEDLAKYGDVSDRSAEWAVAETKKWFFDYEDLTEFEQKFMKKIIPFYTWVRKNVALQLTQVAEKKNVYSQFAKLNNMMRDEDVDDADIPEWAREAGYIPIRSKKAKEQNLQRFIDPGLPYSDLNLLPLRFDREGGINLPKLDPKAAVDDLLSMADPTIKSAMALSGEKGYDVFRRKDLGTHGKAPRVMRFMNKTPKVVAFIDGLIKSAGHEPGLNMKTDKNGKLVMDAKLAQILDNNFLPIKRIGQLLAIPTSFKTSEVNAIEAAVEEATGTKDHYEAAERLFQTLSVLLGYKLKDMDLDAEDKYRMEQALKRAEAKRSAWKKQQPGYQDSSDKWRKARESKVERMRSAL